MPSKEELKLLQSLPLEVKVMKTKQRIKEWVEHFGVDGVCVSFSGGKDSTVLLHLVREMYPNVEAVFSNTGLEYPEIQKFVKTFDNVTIIRPKMRFDEVIKKYGYPMISKETGNTVFNARLHENKGDFDNYFSRKLNGKKLSADGTKSMFNCEKYKPLLNVDFMIGDRCCIVMKKSPLKKYQHDNEKLPIIATMAQESKLREEQWLKFGCNAFDSTVKTSKPMSFWTEQDVLHYIDMNKIPIASVYGDIVSAESDDEYQQMTIDNSLTDLKCTGCARTGCIFCGFGAHMEKGETRFQRLKRTHPKQYDYCMNGGGYDTDGLWKPTKEGLGMKHVLDVLNGLYGEDFIKY